MAAPPVSGAVRSAVEGQGRATGAGWPGSTTAVEWSTVPWQELPTPRSSGASATTTDAAAAGVGVKALAAAAEGAWPWGAGAGEQQKNTATSMSAQTAATGRPLPLRHLFVRTLVPVIAAIVDGV